MDDRQLVRWLIVVGLAILVASTAGRLGAEEARQMPKGWRFTLPDGDPVAGRALFFDRLSCHSCHDLSVPGVSQKPGYPGTRKPGYGNIGPDLDGYTALPAEFLAEGIIRSHHVVRAPGDALTEHGATMGNYNHVLVIQELLDLVAFIRSPGGVR